MIQNNGRAITKRDLDHIWCASTLPYFGGGVLQYQENMSTEHVYKLGIVIDHSMIYVEGLGNGEAKVLWGIMNDWFRGPGLVNVVPGLRFYSNLQLNTAKAINQIDSNLSINAGERKIILVMALSTSTSVLLEQNKIAIRDVSLRKIFGFYVYNPKPVNGTAYFISKIVFTPKAGLFSATAPQP
jgi:hypothetical protein